MNKHLLTALAFAALFVIGCKDKPQQDMQSAAQTGGALSQQGPIGVLPSDGNPHANITSKVIPAGAGHKGKVLSTMDAAGYTYVEVEEKGEKLWVAVMKTAVKVGDEVEFPDSQPMENFHSRTLERTFDKIFFATGLRVNGK